MRRLQKLVAFGLILVAASLVAVGTFAPYAVGIAIHGPRPHLTMSQIHGETTGTEAWIVYVRPGLTLKVSGEATDVAGLSYSVRNSYSGFCCGDPGVTGTNWDSTPGYFYVVVTKGEWDIIDCTQVQNGCPQPTAGTTV